MKHLSVSDVLFQRYIDGALSDSTPFSSLKNTIIVSPFSGESDICPDDNPVYCQEVRLCNMSININLFNVHRIIQAFFPPEPEVNYKHLILLTFYIHNQHVCLAFASVCVWGLHFISVLGFCSGFLVFLFKSMFFCLSKFFQN